jgi:YjbE family integral membrane protein
VPSAPRILIDGFSIVLIDLLLAGDNALVIALAVRSLPPRERKLGIALGAAAAVVLRILITFVAVKLLGVEYIKLVGGAFVLWIAVKVFSDSEQPKEEAPSVGHFLQAMGYIVFADLTMSVDNILAVAGASHGSVALIVFGLCFSIPFVVVSSNLLAKLMDRFPVLLYVGAAILGKVGAEMMLTDAFVTRTVHPSAVMVYAGEVLGIAGVLIASLVVSRRKGKEPAETPAPH